MIWPVEDNIGWFVTGTGTDVGKTLVSRALTTALVARQFRVAAIKPIETGCAPSPADALLLASACGQSELALLADWYRAEPPLAPYAVELATGRAAPDLALITSAIRRVAATADRLIVEGAGGLVVPLDRQRTMADFAVQLELPLLVVANNRLGVLSDVLATCAVAEQRGLRIRAIVLNDAGVYEPLEDLSRGTNARILRERLQVPVLEFPRLTLQDATTLGATAESIGLVDSLLRA